jgi:hypothetical protein
MNREFSYIDAIEMSTYFENYDGDGNEDFHLKKGELRERLKKALPKIAAIGAAVGLGIAFGPALLSAVAPMMPAIKKYLQSSGVDTKGMGAGEKIKAFYKKVFKADPDLKDKEGPKKAIEKILQFFKDLKSKKDSGQLGSLEKALVETAEKTLLGIESGNVDPADLVNETETGSKGKSKEGVEVTTKIDTKTILIAVAALVALMYFSKK